MGLLSATGIVAGYGAADEILKGVDFAVDAGEIVCIIGPNGAGKSTLLKAIAGLLQPKPGAIMLDGRDVTRPPPREISRAGLAYVPQEHNVFPTMSVRENLEMGGYIDPKARRRGIDAGDRRGFRCSARKRRHAARTLSGGERQILAMAMALMVEPRVLLLDEPSAGPLAACRRSLFDAIAAINRDGVVDRHGGAERQRGARRSSHRAYILVDGRNSRTGPAPSSRPTREIKRLFLGA